MSNFQISLSDYMSRPPCSVAASSSLDDAYAIMLEHKVSSLPVLDGDQRLAGLISRTDLLRVGQREGNRRPRDPVLVLPGRTVAEEMTRDVHTLSPEDSLEDAAKVMVEKRIHRIVITEDGQVVGLLSTFDLMRAIEEKRTNDPVRTYMSSPVFTIRTDETLGMAAERLERARISGLVVLEDGWPVGIFTQVEALEARDLRRITPLGDVMNPRLLTLSPDTKLHRAAAQAVSTRVRRIVVQEGDQLVGILTGLDFARAVA